MKKSTVSIALAFLLMIAGGYAAEKLASPRIDQAPDTVRIAELPPRPEKWERLHRLFEETSRYATHQWLSDDGPVNYYRAVHVGKGDGSNSAGGRRADFAR